MKVRKLNLSTMCESESESESEREREGREGGASSQECLKKFKIRVRKTFCFLEGYRTCFFLTEGPIASKACTAHPLLGPLSKFWKAR